MDDSDKTDSSKEIILRFGLKIDKVVKGKDLQFKIASHNEGIPDAEVILIIETWLEKIKENFKQPLKDGFNFFHPSKKWEDCNLSPIYSGSAIAIGKSSYMGKNHSIVLMRSYL